MHTAKELTKVFAHALPTSYSKSYND